MITSSYDEGRFGRELLDPFLEWVIEYFNPSELYGEKMLFEYLRTEYEAEDIFDL